MYLVYWHVSFFSSAILSQDSVLFSSTAILPPSECFLCPHLRRSWRVILVLACQSLCHAFC